MLQIFRKLTVVHISFQVFNVFSGLEMCQKKELHAQPVTAITFFNPLKYVITGAQDGCSKCSVVIFVIKKKEKFLIMLRVIQVIYFSHLINGFKAFSFYDFHINALLVVFLPFNK